MFLPMDDCKKCLRGTKCCEHVVKGILLQCYDVFLFCQSHPRGQEPNSQLRCLLVHLDRNASTHTHTQTHKQAVTDRRHTQHHTPSPSESWSRVKCCSASPSLLPPPPPHLFDSQGQGDPSYNGTPFITAGTITGDVSLSENFKPFFPIPLSLSSASCALLLSFFFVFCPPATISSSSLSSALPLCMAPNELCCRSDSH